MLLGPIDDLNPLPSTCGNGLRVVLGTAEWPWSGWQSKSAKGRSSDFQSDLSALAPLAAAACRGNDT